MLDLLSRSTLFISTLLILSGCGSESSSSNPADKSQDQITEPTPDDNEEDNAGGKQPISLSWSTAVTLSNETVDAVNPSVAIDNLGNAIVAWVEQTTPPSLHAANLDTTSELWSQTTQIDHSIGEVEHYSWNYARYSRSNPQTSIGGGSSFVAWIQNDGRFDSVFVNQYDGTSWGNPTALEAYDDGNATEVRIKTDKQGNTTVVWSQYVRALEVFQLMSVQYDSESRSWGTIKQISSENESVYKSSLLSLTPNNEPAVVWVGYGKGTGGKLYYSELVNEEWTSPELVSEGSIVPSSLSFSSTSSQPIVAWSKTNTESRSIIELAQKDNQSWATTVVNNGLQLDAYSPDIGILPDGGFLIAWAQYMSRTTNSHYIDLYSRQYSPSSGWSDVQVLDSQSGTLPKIVTDKYGRAAVMWYSAQVRHLDSINGWSDKKILNIGLSPEHRIDMNSEGLAIAAWRRDTSPSKINVSLYK